MWKFLSKIDANDVYDIDHWMIFLYTNQNICDLMFTLMKGVV